MNPIRSFRKQICRALIGTLLLAQISVASYACPSMSDQAMTPIDVAAAKASAGTLDTPGMVMPGAAQQRVGTVDRLDAEAAALCVEHCRFGQQSNASTPAPAIHAAFLHPLYALVLAPVATSFVRSQAAIERPMATAAPPFAILHCCFRI